MWVVRLFLGTLIGPFPDRASAQHEAASRGGKVVKIYAPW